MERYDVIIIGGGFYGLRIATFLHEQLGLKNVLILEKEAGMMTRASYVNQARIHNGYHYPRSLLTALRSRVNFPIFAEEYPDAVVQNFVKYYAIAKKLSKVNANQFRHFCNKIGADIHPVSKDIKKKFNPNLVEEVFRVKECAFDSWKLRDSVMKDVERLGVSHKNGVEVLQVAQKGDAIEVKTTEGAYEAGSVLNCGYSQINTLNRRSGLPLAPFKHEVAEMCLVELPKGMEDFSITVMDGPFFSIMPFPTRGLHTLSHVRYTPHTAWPDNEQSEQARDPHKWFKDHPLKSNFTQMYADVVRYIPALKNMRQRDSVWEIKTVLVQSEDDDSRPILFKPHFGLKNYTCIMGGKLDNIYDVFKELEGLYGGSRPITV
jgi:glycine/D-amino acid oxidase-like deaminating enzyme